MVWKNVPIPETIVLPIALGVGLEVFFPHQLFPQSNPGLYLAILLLLLALVLILWSVRTAGLHDLASPDLLLTDGPYAFSRNPMYLAWLMNYLAVFFLNPSLWLAVFFLPALYLTHYLAILPEEQELSERFGDRYVQYCQKVRRYI